MLTLGAFLASVAGRIAIMAAAALGFAVVTYAGVDSGVTWLLAQAKANWGSATGALADYLAMAGLNTAMSVIVAAISARVTLMIVRKFMIV
ncbi:MAG: DUF2523 family protein [Rubrivivax sp.]|nr:DUF2523 family protein [Rubrivivax sp.]MDP3222268.1 DUF2523 family protein [Rubrivivax sp.]MDP3614325.1 DUF2523 family protein [Rubrivivax sp.]